MSITLLLAAASLVSILVWLLVFIIVVYLVFLIVGMLPVPQPWKNIITCIVALIFLLILLQQFALI